MALVLRFALLAGICLFSVHKSEASVVPFVAGTGQTPAADALHACIVIALEAEGSTSGRLSGGSIVTRNRVLTSAHGVYNANVVRVSWFDGDNAVEANRQRTIGLFVQIIPEYDPVTRSRDLAVITFPTDTFPEANVVPVATALPTGNAFLAGFGFQSDDAITASLRPILAAYTIGGDCSALNPPAAGTVCAASSATAFACMGDGGSGLYAGEADTRQLIGVLTRFDLGCTAGPAVFTAFNDPFVQRFLFSQSVAEQPEP